jgi:hypothetical protein
MDRIVVLTLIGWPSIEVFALEFDLERVTGRNRHIVDEHVARRLEGCRVELIV